MASAQAGQHAAALAYLTPPPDATPGMHAVQFYTDDEALVRAVSPWAAEGLRCGEAVVAIATSAHLAAFDRALQEQGHDLAASRRESRYLTIDAREALAGFMVDDAPDLRLLEDFFGPLFDRAARSSRNGQVRAYGEMVNMLWGERKAEAVLRLEECWNTLLGKRRFSLLCAYHLDEFAAHEHEPAFSEICSRHSAVSPALAHTMLPPGRAPRVVAELEQRARALETEVARSRQLEAELRAKVEQLDRLVEAERAEREESEILFRVTDATSRAATLEQIYEAALDAIGSGLGVPRASVLLFDPDGVIRFKAWRGLSDAYRAAVEGHSPWKADEKAPSPVLVEDFRQDPALAALSPVFEAEKIRALAFFPLFSNGLLLGKFMLYYPEPHRFSATEKRLAQGIAHQVAFAVERKFAQQERDRILGIVSHDLRNPLGAVTMAASALLRQNVDGTIHPVRAQDRQRRGADGAADLAASRLRPGAPRRRDPDPAQADRSGRGGRAGRRRAGDRVSAQLDRRFELGRADRRLGSRSDRRGALESDRQRDPARRRHAGPRRGRVGGERRRGRDPQRRPRDPRRVDAQAVRPLPPRGAAEERPAERRTRAVHLAGDRARARRRHRGEVRRARGHDVHPAPATLSAGRRGPGRPPTARTRSPPTG